MNEAIKTVLVGKQKQANRYICAITNFVERMVPDKIRESLSAGEAVRETLQAIINKEYNNTGISMDEEMILALLLGDYKMPPTQPIVRRYSNDSTGKCNFGISTDSHSCDIDDTPLFNLDKESKEVEAYELVKEILSSCSNREDYPEDDVLAALLYGEVYWNER